MLKLMGQAVFKRIQFPYMQEEPCIHKNKEKEKEYSFHVIISGHKLTRQPGARWQECSCCSFYTGLICSPHLSHSKYKYIVQEVQLLYDLRGLKKRH